MGKHFFFFFFFFPENQVRLAQKGSQETVRRRIPLKLRFYCIIRKYKKLILQLEITLLKRKRIATR